MTVPAYFMQVAAGANGASHSITSRPFDGFIPAQQFFFGLTYEATRASGSDTCQLRQRIEWFTAAGGALTSTDYDTTINATVGKTYIEGKHTAPATAAYGKMKVIITPTAAPMQHTVKVHSVRLALTERGADITSGVSPASTTRYFNYNYTGTTADTGQFPRDVSFTLTTAAGTIGSGVTWTYEVVTGTVNGFTSASGVKSMSGTGAGTITISSLGSNSAEVRITATYGTTVRTGTLLLEKTFSPAPVGGGGGETTLFSDSASAAVDGATFGDVTGTNVATMPSGKTTLRLSMNFDVASEPGTVGPFYSSSHTTEAKFQVEISSVWTDYGTVQTTSSSYTVDSEVGVIDDHGSFNYSYDVTGLTAGNSYNCRVMMRENPNSGRWANVGGTFVGTAP